MGVGATDLIILRHESGGWAIDPIISGWANGREELTRSYWGGKVGLGATDLTILGLGSGGGELT